MSAELIQTKKEVDVDIDEKNSISKDRTAYRQIMKATSLFGGVQAIQILISIGRSKVIAVLLGPAGMGIAGLLSSTLGMVQHLTNFGLKTSAVKDVSAAHATKNAGRIATVVSVFRRLVWGTGFLGVIVVLLTAPYLSELAFGSKEYTWSFMLLSVILLFQQITSGQNVLMQGTRKLKLLAKASVLGSFISLVLTVPLYYLWGIDGIVPALILTAFITLLVSWYYANQVKIREKSVSFLRTIAEGKEMMVLGFAISLTGLINTGTSYIVKIFISNTGGVDEVGLYKAGLAVIVGYVGMVFTAMSKDYYPRLAGSSKDLIAMNSIVNQQAEIAILILGPIILVFLVFIDWVVIILYSSEFLAIEGMIHWAILGMFFKAAGWCMGYMFLARGDSKLFFWNELISNGYTMGLNIAGYYFLGLVGLGMSYLVGYILYVIQVYIVTGIKYRFRVNKDLIRVFITQTGLAVSCFTVINMLHNIFAYLIGTTLILISMALAIYELNRRMDLKGMLEEFKNKNKH